MDVQVMRGANCWTDHKLVRAKLRCVHNEGGEKKMLPLSSQPLLGGMSTGTI